jgi:hypothetical protein
MYEKFEFYLFIHFYSIKVWLYKLPIMASAPIKVYSVILN